MLANAVGVGLLVAVVLAVVLQATTTQWRLTAIAGLVLLAVALTPSIVTDRHVAHRLIKAGDFGWWMVGAGIAWDNKGGTAGVGGVTSLSIDITAAAVGAVVVCHVQIASNVGATTFANWTLGAESDEGTSSHAALWWRAKQSGDTTFSVSWTGSNNATATWSSYTGVDTTTPFELLTQLNHTASSASYVTSSQTPTAATRWAVGTFGYRGTTAARTWTNTGTLTQRQDTENLASRWSGTTIGDSNGTVAQSAQSFTATLSAAEAHGSTFILFLIPAAGAAAADIPRSSRRSDPWNPARSWAAIR